MAFSNMLDASFTLLKEPQNVHRENYVNLQLSIYSKTLSDVISKATKTFEKRLMLDIAVARESFRNMEISSISFIRSSNNIADGLTKFTRQGKLQAVLLTEKLVFTVEQWIVWENTE